MSEAETGVYFDLCRLAYDYGATSGYNKPDTIKGQAVTLLDLWRRLTADEHAWSLGALPPLTFGFDAERSIDTQYGILRFVADESVPANTVLIHDNSEWGRLVKPLVYVLPEDATI